MSARRSRRLSIFQWLVAAAVLMGFSALPVAADTIRLKNGQTITGKIVSYSDRKFTIVYERSSADTRATITLDDIESVEFDGRPLPTGYAEPSSGASDTTRETGSTREMGTTRETGSTRETSTTRETGTTREVPPADVARPAIVRDSQINVVAKDDWTFAKIEIQKGDRVKITADGRVRLSSKLDSSPDGIETEDRNKLIPDRPTGALIAVIGDDNDDFIFVGKLREFTAQRSGKLFLSVNEGDLSDNTGSFTVRVQIERR